MRQQEKQISLYTIPTKKSINIAAGQIAQSEGFGVVMVSLLPNQPPLPLAPVYYCPNATTGTVSPQCLHMYNKCRNPAHTLFQHLSFMHPIQNINVKLPTVPHNNIDFIALPIMHFSNNMKTTPTVSTIYTGGINNQLTHQQFDHRSMKHIVRMKKEKLMTGLPTQITDFHQMQ